MDELRDYRYYKVDMIHPTSQAIKYIWERIVNTMMDDEAQSFVLGWEKINKSMAHTPFNLKSDRHQLFLKETIKKLYQLEDKVDVKSEIASLKRMLI